MTDMVDVLAVGFNVEYFKLDVRSFKAVWLSWEGPVSVESTTPGSSRPAWTKA